MSRSILSLSTVVAHSQLTMIGCVLAKFVCSHTSQVRDQMMRTIVNRSPLLEKLYVRVKKLGKRRIRSYVIILGECWVNLVLNVHRVC